jgi:XTP/dITP diphosphohydrolase
MGRPEGADSTSAGARPPRGSAEAHALRKAGGDHVRRLVLASGNEGKLREFRRLLAPYAIDVVAQAELGVPEAAEPHATFVENALEKARHASRATALPALADDSGICVTALGGAPGVHSAYFAGMPRSDARNNAKLVETLAGVADRRAHYACVLVVVTHPDDPEPIIAEGRWHGRVVDVPRGSGGFGYDPHFEDVGSGLTGAELPLEQKNALSHRGKAMRTLIDRMVERGMLPELER